MSICIFNEGIIMWIEYNSNINRMGGDRDNIIYINKLLMKEARHREGRDKSSNSKQDRGLKCNVRGDNASKCDGIGRDNEYRMSRE